MSTTGGGSMDEQGREPIEELDLEPVATVRRGPSRALWAALAALAVATGAVVVTSADDDGDQRPGLPVDLASAMRSGGGAPEAAADSMVAWVEYVPGDDLPALGGEATAYRLSGVVDEGQVRELASALGLDGEVRNGGDGSWSVTGEGGEGRLEVHAGGGAYWSYFAGYQDCADAAIRGCDGDGCVTKGEVTECTASGSPGVAGGAAGDAICDANADCAMPTTTTVTACSGPPEAPCPSEPAPACPGPLPGEEEQPCAPDHVERLVECPGAPIEPATATTACADTGSECAADDCIASDEPPGASPDRPAEDDARERALEVVAATGSEVDGARVEAAPGFASWYVTVEPVLDGVPSGLQSSVEVGPDLQVLSGNGVFGDVEGLGEYPVLDTRAAIERANQNAGYSAVGRAADADEAVAGTTGGTDTGGTDVGGTDDVDAPVTTVVEGTDPCAVPEGASDGCGGTTGCGGDGCAEPTTTIPCKVQPDGREICEVVDCVTHTAVGTDGGDDVVAALEPCDVPSCPPVAPPGNYDGTAPGPHCSPPPEPGVAPIPEPRPVEIVLVDAERSLVLFPAIDGSRDAYLVPAYRFDAADGGTVDLPAVADEALTGPVTTETTVPDTLVPEPMPEPVPAPPPCEVLEEQGPEGESATTHTVQTCQPACPPQTEGSPEACASPYEILLIGKPYYVDIDVQCAGGAFSLGGWTWVVDGNQDLSGWADPGERHEGGTFTLDSERHGTFVGDAAGDLTAEFRTLQPNEDIFCTPEPR